MNRRNAIKLSTVTALGLAINAEACPSNKACKGDMKACHSDMENDNINRTIMKMKDPKHPTRGELKHTPQITIGKKDAKGYTNISITVGQDGIIHPSIASHWIYFIKLHADDRLVGITNLEAEISRGATAFSVKLDNVKKLTATSGCNLHGIWSSSLKV